ncbi:hypothetical protein NDU88_002700 [Pleurodeles waltl]|uniref:Uncharacterized protein n=1 Tax=Pleurodeles waltl TaxID=8319 RepID=A0AAV7TLA9_PLEWA|nr:hypothetical protein NDU88_002700 [Pleurodeles waltl]
MGKTDTRQSSLRFDARKSAKQPTTEPAQLPNQENNTGKSPATEENKSVLHDIDLKIESLTQRIDVMKDRLDLQHTRITASEHRISDVENNHAQQDKMVKEMQGELHWIQLKNEDLEGASRGVIQQKQMIVARQICSGAG